MGMAVLVQNKQTLTSQHSIPWADAALQLCRLFILLFIYTCGGAGGERACCIVFTDLPDVLYSNCKSCLFCDSGLYVTLSGIL